MVVLLADLLWGDDCCLSVLCYVVGQASASTSQLWATAAAGLEWQITFCLHSLSLSKANPPSQLFTHSSSSCLRGGHPLAIWGVMKTIMQVKWRKNVKNVPCGKRERNKEKTLRLTKQRNAQFCFKWPHHLASFCARVRSLLGKLGWRVRVALQV